MESNGDVGVKLETLKLKEDRGLDRAGGGFRAENPMLGADLSVSSPVTIQKSAMCKKIIENHYKNIGQALQDRHERYGSVCLIFLLLLFFLWKNGFLLICCVCL